METKKAKTKVAATVLALAGLCVFSLFSIAGDLEPSGPPGPTMKTLDEVEPRIPIPGSATPTYSLTIRSAGSYYLTGNRKAETNGILIEANDVTIDLMGYTLRGSDSDMTSGISMNGRTNVEIRNGTVRDFKRGIREQSSDGKQHRVIGVRVVSNRSSGIDLSGLGHMVKDCTATENGDTGIYVGTGSTVTGNTAYNNGSRGIDVGTGSTVTGNTAYNNYYSGISVGASTVIGNTAYNNGTSGIFATGGCTVTGNTAYNNGHHGIFVFHGCTVTGNTVMGNQFNGIYLSGNNCLVDQNTAYENNQSGGTYVNMNTLADCTYGLNHAP